jgi:hypothetical protein
MGFVFKGFGGRGILTTDFTDLHGRGGEFERGLEIGLWE